MTTNRWRLKGQYFESCNCEILCPCIVQTGSVKPTYGHCDVGLAFHIEEGDLNGVSLDGLNFLAANYTPGNMGDGNWTAGYYVDESASPEQREAMEQILSGEMGGPAERWRALTTDFRGIKYVPIEFKSEGRIHSINIPGIIDFQVEGVAKPGQDEAMQLVNAGHPVTRDLYIAKGTKATYTDHGMTWDNTGKNAHYAPFDWSWP
ncbi:MAG: DUF1326 domain-containing protein [Dehalococcoidia bacterium]|jgi:hypothetical protein|nr:DUF1326 domain-containing protein [Dehalococcoidia bacterium]PKB83105.1 MAG: hypothetical protein BZY84_01330 [SAR202 cluster bacterium MP-SInd-SRR3963457-G1]PKB85563.1 MAG: hypothetical protein BZY86_01730 [SAR202 cluster bacterium MP-NPac-SRR3961935-G1]|tara:strand:+ start:269 stop:883 length:615 start_codon:yes stop_codon:yes gene_type:complete